MVAWYRVSFLNRDWFQNRLVYRKPWMIHRIHDNTIDSFSRSRLVCTIETRLHDWDSFTQSRLVYMTRFHYRHSFTRLRLVYTIETDFTIKRRFLENPQFILKIVSVNLQEFKYSESDHTATLYFDYSLYVWIHESGAISVPPIFNLDFTTPKAASKPCKRRKIQKWPQWKQDKRVDK